MANSENRNQEATIQKVLEIAIRKLQRTDCNLQTTICNLETVICNMESAFAVRG